MDMKKLFEALTVTERQTLRRFLDEGDARKAPSDRECELWKDGNKIGAWKLYRDRTGCSLREACEQLDHATGITLHINGVEVGA